MSFELQLKAFAEKCGKNAHIATRKILLDISTSVVYKSPVGDAKYWKSAAPKGYVGGRFRGNWQYGFGSIPSDILDKIDPSGNGTISQLKAAIEADEGKPGIYYIVNNLPYALRIEEGWSYRQAPEGVVGLTVVEFQTYVDNAVKGMP